MLMMQKRCIMRKSSGNPNPSTEENSGEHIRNDLIQKTQNHSYKNWQR